MPATRLPVIVRVISLWVLIGSCPLLLWACAHWPDRKVGASLPSCSELEGYPDCQDGHLVPLVAQTSYAEERARIEDLEARFVIALDSSDADALADCFTQNGVLEWAGDIERGRRQIEAAMAGRLGAPAVTDGRAGAWPVMAQHVVTNTALSIDGNEATVQSYWIELRKNAAHRVDVLDLGRYQDELVRRNGRWFIASRRIFDDEPGRQ